MNEKQHDSQNTLAFYSQNDEEQPRRLNQACTKYEDKLLPVSSTAESTTTFPSLLIQLATDDLPAYLKRNASSLTFPEKVRVLNSVVLYIIHWKKRT